MIAFATTLTAAALAGIAAIGPLGLLSVTETPGALPPTSCPTPLASGTIATIAGNGKLGSDGDGGPAIEAAISPGSGIAVDQAGNVYFTQGQTIRRIATDGVIATIASTTTGAELGWPTGLAFGPDGSLYASDIGASRIWRVEEDGTTTAVAGTGVSGTVGNEGPALDARIQPVGLAIDAHGALYFDDLNNYRRVDAGGVIHAFAGSLEPGFGGDGGPALEASFGREVQGIATDGQGNVYLGDSANRRIRKVDPAGTITTIAGSSDAVPGTDVGSASEVYLTATPYGFAAAADGSLYVSEWGHNSVRRIDPAGNVTMVVASSAGVLDSVLGDCGPAAEASLRAPQGIAVHDGVLYIIDSQGYIRVVKL